MNKNLNWYVFLAKIFFEHFEDVELHALGKAITVAARLTERLKAMNLGTVTKIETTQFTPEPRKTEEGKEEEQNRRVYKKVKMIVYFKRNQTPEQKE